MSAGSASRPVLPAAAELRALAARLMRLAELAEDRQGADPDGQGPGRVRAFERDLTALAALAESEYRARRGRERRFAAGLFGEPAWDMLLDLYVNCARGRRISVSSLCLASARPYSTALRWLSELERAGLVVRIGSRCDARVVYIELTRDGFEAMSVCLRERLRALPDWLSLLAEAGEVARKRA